VERQAAHSKGRRTRVCSFVGAQDATHCQADPLARALAQLTVICALAQSSGTDATVVLDAASTQCGHRGLGLTQPCCNPDDVVLTALSSGKWRSNRHSGCAGGCCCSHAFDCQLAVGGWTTLADVLTRLCQFQQAKSIQGGARARVSAAWSGGFSRNNAVTHQQHNPGSHPEHYSSCYFTGSGPCLTPFSGAKPGSNKGLKSKQRDHRHMETPHVSAKLNTTLSA
jgi:hypothetical protein